MDRARRWISRAVVVTLAAAAASPAAAVRPTCSQLMEFRAVGRSVEQIVQTYGTTRARLAACAHLATQGERFASRRERFHHRRAQRGLAP